jgi:hypothetical protein
MRARQNRRGCGCAKLNFVSASARFRREFGEALDRRVDAEARLVGEGGVGALRRRAQSGARGRRPVLAESAMALVCR